MSDLTFRAPQFDHPTFTYDQTKQGNFPGKVKVQNQRNINGTNQDRNALVQSMAISGIYTQNMALYGTVPPF